MISQSLLHWSGLSRGRFDSGEGVEFQTSLSQSQSKLVTNCKLDCKRLVLQFFAVPVWFFDYLDLFRTGSGLTCLIWKAETGLSRTLKHYFCAWTQNIIGLQDMLLLPWNSGQWCTQFHARHLMCITMVSWCWYGCSGGCQSSTCSRMDNMAAGINWKQTPC